MAKIRSAKEIAEKWGRVTPGRAPDYEYGVKNPKADWEAGALKAKDAWSEGVTSAVQEDRFAKGVKKATTAKWQKRAIEKGVPRWPQGVRLGLPDYEAGFTPFAEEIARIELPPRFPKGDPRNLERVAAIATALHQLKRKIKGI